MLKKIYSCLAVMSFLAIFFVDNNIAKVILLLLGIWLLPVIQDLLQKFNIYISNITIIIVTVITIIIVVATVILTGRIEKENIHKHTISDWVYDKESGLEYKKCKSCGEIFEKRVPDIVYSTVAPTDEKGNETKEKEDEEITEEEVESIEEKTERIEEEIGNSKDKTTEKDDTEQETEEENIEKE